MAKLRIQQLAKQRKMTMVQLAEKLNIDRVNLYNSIKGNPTLSRLQAIADALDVPVAELFASDDTDVRGYLEINGEVRTVRCLADLENAVAFARSIYNESEKSDTE